MMCRVPQFFAIALAAISLLQNAAIAQKAEPVRIEFSKGATGTTVKDVLRGRQQKEYVLSAKKGQTLQCRLRSSPPQATSIKLLAPSNNEVPLGKMTDLRETGDFVILIDRVAAGKGAARFSLTVEIH